MISVVIPNYNSAKYLAETVQSVQAQTMPAWELLIVDDGSKDTSLAIAEELARQDSRISVHAQANAGASSARNHGLSKARPDFPYALCLDSDDLLLPGAFKTLLALLEAQPEAPAACGFLSDMDADGHPIETNRFEPLISRRGVEGLRLVRRRPEAPLVFGDLCFRNHIITPGQVLIRKIALEKVGVFDTSLVYVEDYDLWWRLTMQAGPIPVTPQPVLRYRHHGASISRNKAAVKRGQTAWRQRLLSYPKMTPQQRHIGRVGYFYFCAVHWEQGVYFLRKGYIKLGLGLIYGGVRDLMLSACDLLSLRRQAQAAGKPVT